MDCKMNLKLTLANKNYFYYKNVTGFDFCIDTFLTITAEKYFYNKMNSDPYELDTDSSFVVDRFLFDDRKTTARPVKMEFDNNA